MILTAVLIAIDQVSKILAVRFLQGKGVVNVLGDVFILKYIQNRGAFLSFGSGLGDIGWLAFFVILPIIALVAISVYVIIKKISNPYYLTIWVLVISGGAGNLIDRVLYGKVTDFLNFGIGNFRTGILNIADLYICFFTIIIILYYALFKIKKEVPAQEK
jgi:Lipoprotein signal peptidase